MASAVQMACWRNPVCFCLFFYVLGYFLLSLYFALIFSLYAESPNFRARRGCRVFEGLHHVCSVSHRCMSPWYTAGHAVCLSPSASGCSLYKSVNFWMKPAATEVNTNPENALFWGSKNVPACALALVLDIYSVSTWSCFSVTETCVLHSSCSGNPTALGDAFFTPSGGCLSGANDLRKDMIDLETLQWKLGGVSVALRLIFLPEKGRLANVPSSSCPVRSVLWEEVVSQILLRPPQKQNFLAILC